MKRTTSPPPVEVGAGGSPGPKAPATRSRTVGGWTFQGWKQGSGAANGGGAGPVEPGRRTLRRHLVSLAIVVAASALQWLLWPIVSTSVFLLYYPAVVLGTLYGAGFTALVLSLVAVSFFSPPHFTLHVVWPEGIVRLAIFAAFSSIIVLLGRSRETAARLLREERDKARAILGSVDVGVGVMDPDGRILSLNPAAVASLGAASEADLLSGLDRFRTEYELRRLDGTALPFEEWPLERALRGEYVRDFEARLVRLADGETRTLSYRVAPVADGGGRVANVVFSMLDLTEQRRAEADRRATEARLAAIFAHAPSAIALVRTATRTIEDVNPAWVSLFGYSREEQIGRSTPELGLGIDPDERDALYAELARSGSVRGVETRMADKTGRVHQVRMNLDAITLEGEPYVLASLEDVTDRSRAEASLRESEERLRSAMSSADLGTWTVHPPSSTVDLDARSQQLFGLVGRATVPIEDALGRIHPDDRERVRASLGVLTSDGEGKYDIEFRVHGVGDELRWVRVLGQVLFDGRGPQPRADRMVGVMVDTTERNRATEHLRASEASMEAFFHASPGILNLFDEEGRYLQSDPVTPTYFGLDRQSIRGRSVAELNPVFFEQSFGPLMRRVLSTGRPELNREETGPIPSRPGEFGHFRSSYFPVPLPNGRMGFGSMAIDVTNIKRAEAALRESEERFRTVTDNAASCLFVMDAHGRPTFMNPAAVRVTGYASLDEIRDRPLHDAVHWKKPDGSPYPMEECPIDNAQAALVPVQDQKEIFCRKDGTLFPVSYSVAPLERDGKVVGAVLEFRDITEQKRTEEALRQAIRSRDEFLSIASHELRTPLTSLKLQAQSRQRALDRSGAATFDREKLRTMFQHDARQIDRLARLIDDMLDISRITTGELSMRPEPADLCELVLETARRYEPQFEQAGARLDLQACAPAVGRWDRFRLEQVIANLLMNALKYGAGRPVHVSVSKSATTATLTVRDEGIGIAPADHARVFQRFERAISARDVSGLGLGLYIVREILARHGGAIRVESALGQGATFIVDLPLDPDLAPAADTSA